MLNFLLRLLGTAALMALIFGLLGIVVEIFEEGGE